MSNCEICGKEATINVTILENGASIQKFYCCQHAPIMDYKLHLEETQNNLQLLIDFIQKKNCLPTDEELQQMGGGGHFEPLSNERLVEATSFLQHIVDFMKKYHRFPSQEELPPDPF